MKNRKNKYTCNFDPKEVAAEILHRKKLRRRKPFVRGKIDSHLGELAALRNEGLSYRELSKWLYDEYKIKVDHSWIKRRLDQLKAGKPDV